MNILQARKNVNEIVLFLLSFALVKRISNLLVISKYFETNTVHWIKCIITSESRYVGESTFVLENICIIEA